MAAPSEQVMLSFDAGPARFNFRIVGVALDPERGRVLLHRAEGDDFWSLPGGRAELLEPAEATLRREMREELGAEIAVERLLWVVENFFEHAGKSYHELALYFLIAFPHDSGLVRADGPFFGWEEGGITLIFQWHPLAALDAIPLYPTFLRAGLRALPAAPVHVVHTDVKPDAPGAE